MDRDLESVSNSRDPSTARPTERRSGGRSGYTKAQLELGFALG